MTGIWISHTLTKRRPRVPGSQHSPEQLEIRGQSWPATHAPATCGALRLSTSSPTASIRISRTTRIPNPLARLNAFRHSPSRATSTTPPAFDGVKEINDEIQRTSCLTATSAASLGPADHERPASFLHDALLLDLPDLAGRWKVPPPDYQRRRRRTLLTELNSLTVSAARAQFALSSNHPHRTVVTTHAGGAGRSPATTASIVRRVSPAAPRSALVLTVSRTSNPAAGLSISSSTCDTLTRLRSNLPDPRSPQWAVDAECSSS